MAHRLSHLPGLGARWRRRAGWLALIAVVLAVHLGVTGSLAEQMAELDADQAMPARIEIAYVREMPLAAPVAATAPTAPIATRRIAAVKQNADVPKPAKAASAPLEQAAASATEPAASAAPSASAPDTVAEAASAPTIDAAASAPDAAAFVWPPSTRMSYWLTGNYRGAVTGSAQVEWVHVGSRYQVHLDLLIGPEFAPLITRSLSSEGEITSAGLAPQRYDQETKLMLHDRSRATILFEPGSVLLATGERRPSPPGLQDTASQFVQLTYLFSTRPELLAVGNRIDIPLALPRVVDLWTYDVVDEEPLTTRFGTLTTLHLKPRPRALAVPGELKAEIWFAPQLRYLPVRIRIEQDAETWVDLMISKRPELGAP
jgi:hypothetical protein